MHKRFRTGLQALVDWYSTEADPADMVTKMVTRKSPANSGESETETAAKDDEEVETESIVILVSHGAGCNAMIGAITHQPALTEVSTASLTMAVRKPGKESSDALDDDPMEHLSREKTEGLIPCIDSTTCASSEAPSISDPPPLPQVRPGLLLSPAYWVALEVVTPTRCPPR